MAGLWLAMRVDYRLLERLVAPLLALAVVLLVLTLVPPFGQSINGTRRWLRLGPLSFQPVELAKFALVVYLASFLRRREAVVGASARGSCPCSWSRVAWPGSPSSSPTSATAWP